MSPYQRMFGKSCHLLVELKHKAMLVLKKLNLHWNDVLDPRLNQLNELDEFRLREYEILALYKQRMMMYHDH